MDENATFLYDAIKLYAVAYNKTQASGKDPSNTTELMKNVFQAQFIGEMTQKALP